MTHRTSSERAWAGGMLCVAALLAFGCGDAAAVTQTVLWIDAAPAARNATDRVHVLVESVGSGQQRLDQDVVPEWPIKLVIVPLGADAKRKFRVRFSALDAHTRPLVSLSIVSGFVAKRSLFARLTLQLNCLGAAELEEISVPVERLSTRESAPYEIPTPCPTDTPDAVNADAGAVSAQPDSDAGSEPACATGYAVDGDHCDDIDECAQPARCGGNAACQNDPGTFHCTCQGGYAYVDSKCVNVNECARNNGGCQQHCTDLEGSFACGCDQDSLLLPDKAHCAHWHDRVMIAGDTSEVMYAPALATDAHGNAIATWRQNCNRQNCVWANHFVADSGWMQAQQLTEELSDYLTDPSVSFSARGNASVVWTHSQSGRFALYARRFVPPDEWQAPTTLNVLGTDVVGGVVQVGDDDALAVWSQVDGAGSTLWTRRFVDAAWQPAVSVENDAMGSLAPLGLTAAADGGVLAAWQRTQLGVSGRQLWINRWSADTGWTKHMNIETVPSETLAVSLFGSRDGTALLLASGQEGVWASRFVGQSGWGAAQQIDSDASNSVSTGQVAMDSHGNAIAVWSKQTPSTDNQSSSTMSLWGSHYAADSGWSLPFRLSTQAGDAGSGRVAMDPFGNGVVVWSQSDGTRLRIWRMHYVAGTGWSGSAAMLDGADQGDDLSATVAMDPLGHAIVVWYEATDTHHVMFASRFE